MAGISNNARLYRCVPLWMVMALGILTLAPVKCLRAQGQNPPQQDVSFSVNGSVTEESPGKLTVDGGQNMLFTVKYDSTTQLKHEDGSPAKASDLQVGIKIMAKGVLTEAGDVIARQLTIESKSKAPSK